MENIGKRFAGKVAIVTASTQGIGFAIAERLGLEGAAVVISSRRQVRLHSLCFSFSTQFRSRSSVWIAGLPQNPIFLSNLGLIQFRFCLFLLFHSLVIQFCEWVCRKMLMQQCRSLKIKELKRRAWCATFQMHSRGKI